MTPELLYQYISENSSTQFMGLIPAIYNTGTG